MGIISVSNYGLTEKKSRSVKGVYDPPASVDYLVVAGGGGGSNNGGGGGAGGFRTGTLNVTAGTSYTVEVGAGGAGSTQGSTSTFASIVSAGGGKGAPDSTTLAVRTGGSGGSGGGGGFHSGSPGTQGPGGSGNVPSVSPSQGNNGGYGNYSGIPLSGGGGGGAGGVGSNYPSGDGGIGAISTIISTAVATARSVGEVSGSDVYFAGGGGGLQRDLGAQNLGGLGGGGDGYRYNPPGVINASDGAPNTGGGGGSQGPGGRPGGSGVVIISQDEATSFPTISVGLTYVVDYIAGKRVYQFTSGSGTISW